MSANQQPSSYRYNKKRNYYWSKAQNHSPWIPLTIASTRLPIFLFKCHELQNPTTPPEKSEEFKLK